ncbi:hypothetical protein BOTBODRAFT_39942 [Botryobasidium botryosum FD-172 SS1]|uniref:Protein kinase domain-containing protein n=1 Tax=Botryobasidium botryosum (strain FD-172 SS1) TaxID=930990 RepID=A0A067LRM6_BOTB1|nr:hypothetical protein BOTBODRAFT_39942 [Botryobasidium botryosum FD-172 SS1]
MGEDIEKRDSLGRTKLHHAIRVKDLQLAKQLVEQGADVRARDGHGSEPLHFLARLETDYLDILSPSPFAEIIQVLLSAGAELNAQGQRGLPPLYHAYQQNSSLIFRLLVDAGADLSLLDQYVRVDMRRFLARVLHPPDDTADLDYLPAGVDVNATDSEGRTYLDRAVWLGSPSAVKALLCRGADPTQWGPWGRTPLAYAFSLMQYPDGAGAIQALVDAGADVNAISDRDTPLDRAASREPFDFKRIQGYESVLRRTVQRGSLRATHRLLRLEDDPNLRDDQLDARFRYLTEVLGLPGGEQGLLALAEEGSLIDAINKDGISMLQRAVAKSSCLGVKFLLRQGVDPCAGGAFGAVSPQFVVEMLEVPDGVSMMLKLARAGLTVDNTLRYRMKVRSLPRCFDLICEVRKISAMDPPSVRSACVAFLSTFYPLLGCYSSDSPLHEWEVELMKAETSEQGGFSDCREGLFLGRHKVAMKALRTHVIGNKVAAKRMQREMNVLNKLSHPNVLLFIGWCILESKSYLVSPWMENGDASEYVRRRPQANRVQLLVQVAEGLHYLHTWLQNPVIHGNLKATNVLISGTGVVRIANFALSELVEDEKDPRHWTAWYCCEDLRWQAPELLSAGSQEEARRTKETDSFACGRVMLEIFTGLVPFYYIAANTMSIPNMVRHGQFPERPLDEDVIAKGLDDMTWNLMERCWSMDPKERPSAAEILTHLKATLRGRPDDDSDSEDSTSSRLEKRARVTEPSLKFEEFDA